jgi:alkaline phosphatase D
MNAKTTWSSVERRRFLKYAWSATAANLGLALLPGSQAHAKPLRDNPFKLGVASGDPTPTGIVLWTRLAPEPADPAALGRFPIPVHWRVASDERLRRVVAQGWALAPAQLAHSVHVEVEGLRPGRDYFYQFSVGGEESAIGHFRTAPAHHEWLAELRFAFVTCQDWPSGFYTAYRDMLAHDLDLVLHLGDYTYEYGIGDGPRGPVPGGFGEPCQDLRTYRLRHTLYKLDADLQAAHAAFPFAVIWDDHEVANDYSGLAPEYASPSREFTARRAQAYQAWYEHMPVRSYLPGMRRDELRIYRELRYGKLASFCMLDDRQYRSDNPCGDGEELRCEEALSGRYTMLGASQEAWLDERFEGSRARWNILGQGLLMAELHHLPYLDNLYWNDAWDGYPLARQRLLTKMVDSRLENPIVLTGDWHSTFVNDLKLDFKDPASPTVATEFVTPALTSGGDGTPYGPYYSPMIPFNPHIKYYEGDRRGYFVATVTEDHMQLDLRFVTSVENPEGSGYLETSFVVENGVPGARPA